MKFLVIYKPSNGVDYREVIDCDAFAMNPNGRFAFLQFRDLAPYKDSNGIEWTPIEGALLFAIPFEDVQRIEGI